MESKRDRETTWIASESPAPRLRRLRRGMGVGWLALVLALGWLVTPDVVLADGHAAAEETAKPKKGIEAIDAFIAKNPVDKSQPSWKTRLRKPPRVDFEPGQKVYWKVVTNLGAIRFEMMPEIAPMHVASTMYLTRLGFYEGTGFHRVITGFMAQGGDPLGNGRGGPGYKFNGEFDPAVRHDSPGLLSMANAGPGTDGSQFFITFRPTPALDGRHTIYGRVVEGMETVRKMEALGRPRDPAPPREKITIESASIIIE